MEDMSKNIMKKTEDLKKEIKLLKEENTKTKKIIIPRHLKLEFRDKLDQLNINERIIYPGLDGLSKWLTRNYSKFDKMYQNNEPSKK